MSMRFQCPICGTSVNSYGQPLISEWAVASHVAGKVRNSNERLHKAWARREIANLDPSLSVPKLAEALLLAVHEAMKANERGRIEPTPLSLVQDIELLIHRLIKNRLQERFGIERDAWWVEGVPLTIREECAVRREGDSARGEPYSYTFLIDLKEIIAKSWQIFEADFQRMGGAESKKEFLSYLARLNDIRNRYAHPVRAPSANSSTYQDDLAFAGRVHEVIGRISVEPKE